MDKLTPTMLRLLDCYAALDEGHMPRGTYPRSITRTRAALVARGLVVRSRDMRVNGPRLTDKGRAIIRARAEVEALAEDVERRRAIPVDLLGALQDSIERAIAERVPAATTATGEPADLDEIARRIATAERTRDDAIAMGHQDAAVRACDLLDALVEQRRQRALVERPYPWLGCVAREAAQILAHRDARAAHARAAYHAQIGLYAQLQGRELRPIPVAAAGGTALHKAIERLTSAPTPS